MPLERAPRRDSSWPLLIGLVVIALAAGTAAYWHWPVFAQQATRLAETTRGILAPSERAAPARPDTTPQRLARQESAPTSTGTPNSIGPPVTTAPAAPPSAAAPGAMPPNLGPATVRSEAPASSVPAGAAAQAPPRASPAATPPGHQPIAPSFDIVRVTPEGNAVVAGRAEPGAHVVVREGDRTLGEAVADRNGEFVIIPEGRVGPGGRELTLTARDPDGQEVQGQESVVVMIEPPKPPQGAPARAADTRVAEARPAAPKPTESKPTEASPPDTKPAETAGTPAAPAENKPIDARSTDAKSVDSKPVDAKPTEAEPGDAAPGNVRTAETKPTAAAAPSAPVAILVPHDDAAPRVLQPPAANAQALALNSVDYNDQGDIRFSGSAKPSAPVRVYVDNRPVGETSTDRAGQWSLTPPATMAAGVHQLRVDQLAEATGHVQSRVELPFQRTATPILGLSPGHMVVQPGNNLWRIARQTYGAGARYTVIFLANREQIRDPNRIYPGQVFAVPTEP